LQNTQSNRQTMLQCSWSLGWHVTVSSAPGGKVMHYWGGGVTPKTSSRYLRGDWVEVDGTDRIGRQETSRLARIICGVRITKIPNFFGPDQIHDDFTYLDDHDQRKCQQTVVLLLVRYAGPHPHARLRGPDHRPLCPGELQNTHCLWKWHQRPRGYRRGCWRPRPWSRHKQCFGHTFAQQQIRYTKEARAWYDVIQPEHIKSHTNVQTDWDREDSFLQSIMWN